METILVTGLDGSGKSTFFSNLRALQNPACEILLLPHIDLSLLPPGTLLHDTASFINTLSLKADETHQPPLKALALFSSMLLFRELMAAKKEETQIIFCERHPVIDTGIYAGFYAKLLAPGCVAEESLHTLDETYPRELQLLVSLLPEEYRAAGSASAALLNFIYDWFHLRKKDSLAELSQLFGVPAPSRIYFLKAAPQILYDRIRNRNRLEAHESVEVLQRLDEAYDRLLAAVKKSGKSKVTIIDAGSVASLTGFFETMKQQLSILRSSSPKEFYPAVPGRSLVTPAAKQMRLDYVRALGFSLEQIASHALPMADVQHNIESFVGTTEIPLGLIGPILFRDGEQEEMVYGVAGTLEGALVASMNRGAKAISMSGGFRAEVVHQRMVRAPMFLFHQLQEAEQFKHWTEHHFSAIKKEAEKHSNHAQLLDIHCVLTGKAVHTKFAYRTGDASGQNMTTTCTWYAMLWMVDRFQEGTGITVQHYVIEGNAASDKKISAYATQQGRGVHVTAECYLEEDVIRKVLRTTSDAIVSCYHPSVAVARIDGMHGYNINVANAIAAIFAATGQDLASIHESSAGILNVEKTANGLYLSLNLPSLVIGTVGGGTHLPKQKEALQLMDCYGNGKIHRFAKLIAGFALGLEISTYAAIVSGEFAKAHEKLGRNKPVKWLLRSDLNAKFLREHLKHLLPEETLTSARIDEEALSDNGIITSLAGRTSKKLVGFIPMKLSFNGKAGHAVLEKKLLIKSKPADLDVIKGLHLMAASIDPRLSDLIYEYRDALEYKDCHRKEIRAYELLHEAGFDTIPAFYGAYVDEQREAFLVLQEWLEKSELKLFNTENAPELWSEEQVKRTILAIAEVHSYFAKPEVQAKFPEARVFDADAARPLYEKLAAIMYSDAENESDKQRYRAIMEFPDELKKLHSRIPLTIVHNDFNPRNIAIRENGKVCIYDWELAVKNIPHRDIVELLSFVLPAEFSKEQLEKYLRYHYSVSGTTLPETEWRSGYLRATMEYILTRVMFYKVAGLLMKLKFPSRVLDNALRMLEFLRS